MNVPLLSNVTPVVLAHHPSPASGLIEASERFAVVPLPMRVSPILRDGHPGLSEQGHHSVGIQRIVRRCVEKDADKGYQSTRDLAFDLEAMSGLQCLLHPGTFWRIPSICAIAIVTPKTGISRHP